jgi:hypothetical protein
MDLKDRVKRIILTPKSEWDAISAAPIGVSDLYRNYIVILAAIPAIANFLGNWLFGYARAGEGVVHVTFFGGLWRALAQYAVGLPLIYLVALGISRLAPHFEGESDDLRAFNLVAFSYTPVWLAEAFGLVPGLRWLDVLGLYGVYIFYIGVSRMMRSRPDYSDVYTAAGLGIGVVAAFLHAAIVHLVAPASAVSV